MLSKVCLVLFICLWRVRSWDQIQTKTFLAIFPYANLTDVWKLTFDVNHQNSTDFSKRVVNRWMDQNWIQMPMSKSKVKRSPPGFGQPITKPPPYGRLSDKEFARKQAMLFMEHRGAVKLLFRYYYRIFQEIQLVTEKEAIEVDHTQKYKYLEMRQLFWEADSECRNYFLCTCDVMANKTALRFANPNRPESDFMMAFNVHGMKFSMNPLIAKKVVWQLDGGQANVPQWYKPSYVDIL